MRCAYDISSVREVYTTNAENVTLARESAVVSEADALGAMSVTIGSESSLSNRYTYEKSMTVRLRGRRIPHLEGKRLIVEADNGALYLMGDEFDPAVTWRHTVSADGDFTEWTISYSANLNMVVCDIKHASRYSDCAYMAVTPLKVTMYPKDSALVMLPQSTILSDSRIDLDGTVTMTEDGGSDGITQTVTVEMPLSPDRLADATDSQQFLLYRHYVTVGDGADVYVCGMEHGMDVRTDIQSDGEGGTITLTMSDSALEPAPYVSGVEVHSGEGLFYDYVLYAHDGTPGYVCGGNGTGVGILQRGYLQSGLATEKYRVKNGYQDYFPHLEVTGVFYGTVQFEVPDCAARNTVQASLPASWTFPHASSSVTGEVTAASAWTASVPSGYTMTPSSGPAGTTSVTIAPTSVTDATVASLTISADGGSQTMQLCRLPWSVSSTVSAHDASAFDFKITAYPFSGEASLVRSPSSVSVTQTAPNEWTVSVSANTKQRSVMLRFVLSYGGTEKTVEVTQTAPEVEWRASGGYLCDGEDSYAELRKWVNYGGGWTPTSEVMEGELLQTQFPACVEEGE